VPARAAAAVGARVERVLGVEVVLHLAARHHGHASDAATSSSGSSARYVATRGTGDVYPLGARGERPRARRPAVRGAPAGIVAARGARRAAAVLRRVLLGGPRRRRALRPLAAPLGRGQGRPRRGARPAGGRPPAADRRRGLRRRLPARRARAPRARHGPRRLRDHRGRGGARAGAARRVVRGRLRRGAPARGRRRLRPGDPLPRPRARPRAGRGARRGMRAARCA
jgi:hypothetical protein